MRPPFTKNISYPYDEYLEHWIVGFIYSRVPDTRPQVLTLDDLYSRVPDTRPQVLTLDDLAEVAPAIDDVDS